MLTIRHAQMQVLGLAVLEGFKEALLRHLSGFAPELYALRGEQVFRQVIDAGIARAARHGFTNRGPLRFFLECMFAYGTEFDEDFQIPELQECLATKHEDEQLAHAERVFAVIDRYQSSTRGTRNEFAIAALHRLGSFMDGIDALRDDTLESDLLDLMARIHPEKVEHVGHDRLRRLIALAREDAERFDMATPVGAGVLSGLMFALGLGISRDPLYPWVRDTLTQPLQEASARRIERLRRKTRMYLDATLKNLPA
jgi:hypothetical protein